MAKLLHFQKRIVGIQKQIEQEYSNRVSFFSTPRTSQLFQIIQSASPECLKLTQTPGFLKIILCIKLSSKHPFSKLFRDALLEIKGLQDAARLTIEPQESHSTLYLGSLHPGYK